MSSKDYHDYFIKDGRFIGEFEDMYRNVDDPWHIDALGRRLDMDAALLLVRRQNRIFERTLDMGCGKGFFSTLLAREAGGMVYACDVSETAIREAANRHGEACLRFFTFDLNDIENLPFPETHFDMIAMAQTIWCVLPNIKSIFATLGRFLRPYGGLLISQHFLQPGTQKYGREILSTPEDLYDMLGEAGFRVVDTLETNRHANHHVALWAVPEKGAAE